MMMEHVWKVKSERHAQVWNFYEKLYTTVDFTAGNLFIIGSIMFFFKSWQDPGTWMFLLGSILFALRPTVKMIREFHLARLPAPLNDDGGRHATG